jgi:hypothetical protein
LAYFDARQFDIIEAPFADFFVGCVIEDQYCRFGHDYESLTVR